MTLKEAVVKIQQAKTGDVRVIPAPDSGKYQVEILEDGKWVQLLHPMERVMAEDVLRQAQTKLIFG